MSASTTHRTILFMQTAFIGDVILMTAQLERWHTTFPEDTIDVMVKKGNEGLLHNHPFVRTVLIFDKSKGKAGEIWRLLKEVRRAQYDVVVNHHRFFSSGLIAGLSKAKQRIGFSKNPMSFLYTEKVEHEIGNGLHEVERNFKLIEAFAKWEPVQPKLYPPADKRAEFKLLGDYIVMAPASVWFTKQYPKEKWAKLIEKLGGNDPVYLIGAPGDAELCDWIVAEASGFEVINTAGKMNLLESAALIAEAKMNYVNDSAPMHLATATNAPVTAIYCSTVPAFGFGPRSEQSIVKETTHDLDCRPCGLHGHAECPKGHFKCSEIEW